jgi:hypothetical protein
MITHVLTTAMYPVRYEEYSVGTVTVLKGKSSILHDELKEMVLRVGGWDDFWPTGRSILKRLQEYGTQLIKQMTRNA